MRRAVPFLIATIALFLAACSTGVSPSGGGIDGPQTTITVATVERPIAPSGVPFVDAEPVVTSVDVAIVAFVHDGVVPMRFTLDEGVYTYDPHGDLTSLEFAFAGSATVTLPAGHEYGFATRGLDAEDVWLAYGETRVEVDVATLGVTLALQTMIHAATLEAAPSIDAIAAGQSVDVFLSVTSPGGYAVPTADYEAGYSVATEDGSVEAHSKLGAQVLAHPSPSDGTFSVIATVTGWRLLDGVPTWTTAIDGVVATFDVPFTFPVGLEFDTAAPVATIEAPVSGTVGHPLAVSGTASDDRAVERVQVFAGPVLIASSVPTEASSTVAALELVAGAWSFAWTPASVRSYTLTALVVDTAGNEHRDSTTVDVEQMTTLTFVGGVHPYVPVSVGETVLLSGTAFEGFDTAHMQLAYDDGSQAYAISTLDVVVANGVWTIPWTVLGVAEAVEFRYDDGAGTNLYTWIYLAITWD